MRVLSLILVSFLAAACGLSMNPDLPSSRDGGGRGETSGDGDSIDFGDGDVSAPGDGEWAGGAGGCFGLGGARPDEDACEDTP